MRFTGEGARIIGEENKKQQIKNWLKRARDEREWRLGKGFN